MDFGIALAVLISQVGWLHPLFRWLHPLLKDRFPTRDQLVHHDMPSRAQADGILGNDLVFRWVDRKKVKTARSDDGFAVFFGYDKKSGRYRFVNRAGQVLMARRHG